MGGLMVSDTARMSSGMPTALWNKLSSQTQNHSVLKSAAHTEYPEDVAIRRYHVFSLCFLKKTLSDIGNEN